MKKSFQFSSVAGQKKKLSWKLYFWTPWKKKTKQTNKTKKKRFFLFPLFEALLDLLATQIMFPLQYKDIINSKECQFFKM